MVPADEYSGAGGEDQGLDGESGPYGSKSPGGTGGMGGGLWAPIPPTAYSARKRCQALTLSTSLTGMVIRLRLKRCKHLPSRSTPLSRIVTAHVMELFCTRHGYIFGSAWSLASAASAQDAYHNLTCLDLFLVGSSSNKDLRLDGLIVDSIIVGKESFPSDKLSGQPSIGNIHITTL